VTIRAFTIGELCVSPYNVRTDGRTIGSIEALKQSILKRGVLMPLVVHPLSDDPAKFGAIAGGRRYRALKALIESGDLPATTPIEAVVRDGMTEADLIDISTAENLVRRDLYAYEVFAAVARSRDRGSTLEDIAETIGQPVEWVKKSVRLGMLAPAIFRAFSDEEISLEIARAFAATEDKTLQLHVFQIFMQRAKHEQKASLVRELLKVGDRELTRLLRFVGEKRYRDEGGAFELDLFAEDDEHRGIVSHEGLLRDLAAAKFDQLRTRIRTRAGRDLRFGVTPPKNDFDQADRSLQIHPPVMALDPEDEKRLQELRVEEDSIVEIASELVSSDGQPFPGNEAAIAKFEERDQMVEAAIAAIEDKRPIQLPSGDVFATIDLNDDGKADIRYWWASHKAQAAAGKPSTQPKPRRSADESSALRDGDAIAAPIGEPFRGRAIADQRAKNETGLTADGVQRLRALRRASLRQLLMEDANAGGDLARDYFVWGELRMQLTSAKSAHVGLKPLASPDRDDEEARALIGESVGQDFQQDLAEVASWSCFTEQDLAAAFRAYRALGEVAKGDAMVCLCSLALERSLNADGYRIPVHDVVAQETGLSGAEQLRETGAFTPSPRLLSLFSKDHRLELARPYVSREDLLAFSKRTSPDLSERVAKIFTRASGALLDGMGDQAGRWVHPLIAFPAGRMKLEQEAAE